MDPEWATANSDAVKQGEQIREHLRALGNPPTKMYNGQLPLFPTIYRIEVTFDDRSVEPIIWDSELPFRESEVQLLDLPLRSAPASARVFYQLHAFNIRQRLEQEHQQRLQQLSILAVIATVLVGAWIVLLQRRERQRVLAQRQVDLAERKLLEEAPAPRGNGAQAAGAAAGAGRRRSRRRWSCSRSCTPASASWPAPTPTTSRTCWCGPTTCCAAAWRRTV